MGRKCAQTVVRFAWAPPRQEAFARYLDAHAGRRLCVVVDGCVRHWPHIDVVHPRRILDQGLPQATQSEAREFAALLRSGPLPCGLIPER